MEMQGTTLRKIVKTLIFLQSISTLSLLIKIDYKAEKKIGSNRNITSPETLDR